VLPRISGKNFPFLDKMWKTYPTRWVWGVNPYSIWDQNLIPHNADECHAKTDAAVDVKYIKSVMTSFRKVVTAYTGDANAPFWVGETGWASPFSGSQQNIKTYCPYFGSVEALKKYYQNFVEWDGSLNDGVKGPDLMFYFSNRDSNDFGDPQPFGLVDTCANPECKIQSLAPTPKPSAHTPAPTPSGPTPKPTPAPTPKSDTPTPRPTPKPPPSTPTPEPTVAPSPGPSDAACSAHPKCAASRLEGNCCPNDKGDMLWCCDSVEMVI